MKVFQTKVVVMGAIAAMTVLAFQNCSGTNFQQASADGASMKVDDGAVAPSGVIDPVVVDEDNDGTDPKTGKKCDSKHEHMASNDLVECEIMAANSKVVLNKSKMFELGSNASATRVCMSENACLKMVNSYVASREGRFALGAGTSISQTQVAKIFPGSKGTCKNALALTDATVSRILSVMTKAK